MKAAIGGAAKRGPVSAASMEGLDSIALGGATAPVQQAAQALQVACVLPGSVDADASAEDKLDA